MNTEQIINRALTRIAQIELEGQKELSIEKALLKERLRKIQDELNCLNADLAKAGFDIKIQDNQIKGHRILGGCRFQLSATKQFMTEELL